MQDFFATDLAQSTASVFFFFFIATDHLHVNLVFHMNGGQEFHTCGDVAGWGHGPMRVRAE